MSTVHAVSRTVRDNAALLDASHGRETGSRYVAPTPEGSFLEAVSRDPVPLKIALWRTAPNGTELSPEAAEGLKATGHLLESLGHTVVEAAPVLNGEELGKAALFTISANVAAAIDARSVMLGRDVREDELEPITFAMANLGRTVPMMELARANNLFNAAAITFERFLDDQKLDLILTPTLFRPPEKLGVLALTASPEQMNAAVSTFAPLCPLFNQIGAPAMSVPLHWTNPTETAPQGLPLGMMFGGRCGSEELLYSLAGQLERADPWVDRFPPVWVG
jgi:amidase/6-aminohexanoate-cyclic-dimer hydrolase